MSRESGTNDCGNCMGGVLSPALLHFGDGGSVHRLCCGDVVQTKDIYIYIYT